MSFSASGSSANTSSVRPESLDLIPIYEANDIGKPVLEGKERGLPGAPLVHISIAWDSSGKIRSVVALGNIMERTTKCNVEEFNSDVAENGGYRYTRNAPYSSVVSNLRITDKAEEIIRGLPNVRTVIDVGCGDGTYTSQLKERLPQLSFTGFDPAAQAIAAAQRSTPACTFLVGDILDPGTFPKARFDLAIVRGVIHHLPTQSQAVKNTSRLSNRILIIEPNGNNPVLKWIEKNSDYHIKHEEQSFSSKFLHHICLENGLIVRHLSFIGFVPFFFPTLPAKIIYFLQPLLEKIPLLARFFGAQTIILAESEKP